MPACINRAYRVSRTDNMVIICFTTFRHCTLFYSKRKELKIGVRVQFDLTKARLVPEAATRGVLCKKVFLEI